MKILKRKILLQIFTALVVISQSILVALVATFYLNANYEDKMLEFSNKAITIKINNTNIDKNEEIYRYLEKASNDYNLFYARPDLLLQNEGEKGKIEVGLLGI